MLDSTLYMRNQLLRDSDWTSMAHSLELRTPLVDAALLHALNSMHPQFAQGAGKRMLGGSPTRPLPAQILSRPKSGFGIPMTQWLASIFHQQEWSKSPLLKPASTPWARRWASVVVNSYLQNCLSASIRKTA